MRRDRELGGYRDPRNRADEWAYCAARRIAVAAVGVVCGAAALAALALASFIAYLCWGWVL